MSTNHIRLHWRTAGGEHNAIGMSGNQYTSDAQGISITGTHDEVTHGLRNLQKAVDAAITRHAAWGQTS